MDTYIKTLKHDLSVLNQKLTKCECVILKEQLLLKTNELESVKKSFSTKLGIAKVKTTKLQLELEDQNAALSNKISVLKDQHLNLQKRRSEMIGNWNAKETKLKEDILKLKGDLDRLESEHEPINIMATSGRHRYSNNIRNTILGLIGPCNVPPSKCPIVIQIVANSLFGMDLKKEDLPCNRTCQNISDECHVLAKIQIVERIKEVESFAFHGDGTGRNIKKILGNQLTLSTGEQFSMGFMTLHKEDASTLLEACMSLLHELADIYNPAETETVLKEIFLKFSCLMGDRCSVNKKFGSLLSELRQNSGIEEPLHLLYCNAHFLLGLSNDADKVKPNQSFCYLDDIYKLN